MRLTTPLTAVSIFVTGAVALTALATPASADLRPSDFPTKYQVRTLLDKSGRWQRQWLEPVTPIGSRPTRCDSTTPFRDASQELSASYSRQRWPGNQRHTKSATVVVYEYASAESASAAVDAARTLAESCPKSTEWYCTQCDGVITYWRTPVGRPPLGEESASWIGKTEDLGRTRYRTVVARAGSIVVDVTISVGTPPGTIPFRFPKATPSQTRAVRLTREVLALSDR